MRNPTTINKLALSQPETTSFSVPTSAYIHIPFCRRRCYYCDFPISVAGDKARGETSRAIEHYIEVLTQEIEVTPKLAKPLQTVFFGGGTPSLLSVEQVNHILAQIDKYLGIAINAEISMEIDPGTFDLERLKGYRNAGINRISVGVQAFQDELLKVCGRSHTVADILAAVELIRQVDFPEFSLDLISGLPHQNLAQWQTSLETAVTISPTHISVYDLTIEPTTPFGRQFKPGSQPLPTDETTVQMYKLAQEALTNAGYQHYEISNYAQPGHQCRHNRVYWENQPYYGFGMGAASYVSGRRFTRPRTRKEYYEWVISGAKIDCPPVSVNDILLETLMLGLRLAEGLDLATLSNTFGVDTMDKIWQCLQPYYQQNLVKIVDINGLKIEMSNAEDFPVQGRLSLTDPEGFLLSNTILADLFERLE